MTPVVALLSCLGAALLFLFALYHGTRALTTLASWLEE